MAQHLIFYWAYYTREWPNTGLQFHSPAKLFRKVPRGTIVWMLTRRGKGDYVFVGRFVVQQSNPRRKHQYGQYSVDCIKTQSALVDSSGQRWSETELQRLFGLHRSKAPLGVRFRGASCVRKLPEESAALLERKWKSWPRLDAAASSPFGSIEQKAPSGIPPVYYQRAFGQIAKRRGQKDFRDALFSAFGARCAITGCKVRSVLEGAHVTRVSERQDKGNNGLLLRADIHTLFDLYQISIHPRSFTVWVAPSVRRGPYKQLGQRGAFVPKAVRTRELLTNLARHYKKATEREA